VFLFHAVALDNPKDERLFGCAEVRDMTPVRDESGRVVKLPYLERMLAETLAGMRLYQSRRLLQDRLYWNRILLYAWPPLTLTPEELHTIVDKLVPEAEGLGLEQVVVRGRIPNPETGELREMLVRISNPAGRGLMLTFRPATKLQPLKPLSEYDQKVVRMRQRGLIYPYEIIRMLTPSRHDTRAEFPAGDFVELDLNPQSRLVPVERPFGQNKSNIIAGLIRNFTAKYPEGMTRVVLLGDPSRDLGALAEPECRRIIAALDLAEEQHIPLEWFALSAGAKISMDSGVENMDWIARVLRRLVEFTQAGEEVNLLINGINVGAQPYWNAEATMLMHTRGILVMTPQAAMVLTGKQALDYSGSVSAEDNQGIGGYDRIMGINGQAQYFARDIEEACHILLRHYEHTYLAGGERFPRRAETADPVDRDVSTYPHGDAQADGFTRVGEIFSDSSNAGRKKAFDIRKVMRAVADQDHEPLERWGGMRDAETVVVWDVHLGGYPVCMIGMESRPLPRMGFVPADGPDLWCAGTLFPMSSKKVARAVNAASNNRPVVVLANLSGFDGSPESLRKLQLEYGAEIGRAVVNFQGPIVFCVISRYHGGAYVVFSQTLNDNLEVVALEGSFASVIGGAPAAAVVFAREVDTRTRKDSRLAELNQKMAKTDGAEKGRLRLAWNELYKRVYSEKLGEVAAEFDRVHCVERALRVGALHHILPSRDLRPYLIHALERGMAKTQQLRTSGDAVRQAAAGNLVLD
jgi:acetyl-CoA carboxylase carboxyltransferase component